VEVAFVRKIESAISLPILPSLVNRGLSHRWTWSASGDDGGEVNQAVHNRPTGRSVSGLQVRTQEEEEEEEEDNSLVHQLVNK
jgi:hypothetical protein